MTRRDEKSPISGTKNHVIKLDSYSELIGLIPEIEAKSKVLASFRNDTYFLGGTYESAKQKAISGDDSLVDRAESILDKIENAIGGEAMNAWAPCVYGAYPVVPDYIAGSPTPMRNLLPVGEVSPISVYVANGASSTVSAETILNRGIAILALCLKLQQVRPIDLYVFGESLSEPDKGNGFIVIPIDSRPLSLSIACNAIVNAGFSRGIRLPASELLHALSISAPWAEDYHRSDYAAIRKQAIGIGDNDLVIESAHNKNIDYDFDPITWVNNQLAKYNNQEPV